MVERKPGFEPGKATEKEIDSKREEERKKELLKQLAEEMQSFFEEEEPLADEFYQGENDLVKNDGKLDKNAKDKLIKIAKLAEKLGLPCFRTGIRDRRDEDLSKNSIEVINDKIKFKNEFTNRQDSEGFPISLKEQEVIVNEEERSFIPFIEWNKEDVDALGGYMEESGSLKVYFSPKDIIQVGDYYISESHQETINIAEMLNQDVEFSKFINNLRATKVNYFGRILTDKEFKEQEEKVKN
ncbi:MAG TPA: hypothetical protein P5230_01735 [Candidatus Magasanikbacteria bacterium]|nr:hypothetical protein [Candidatus Magasanikbacteria bacterium]